MTLSPVPWVSLWQRINSQYERVNLFFWQAIYVRDLMLGMGRQTFSI